ncbi:hypothetical protein D5018_21335 [Parashewanella curva]|uniref:Uncharacterized protein n=1 Tax=Parashewanella curva TaxID=2338552 RepID=A0A3L8PQM4_9GAMM|nr:hypothetical protein [Parashewanella curva]RLV57671.1 hypothetical protein D5018_21335 [Parashewanella curva]
MKKGNAKHPKLALFFALFGIFLGALKYGFTEIHGYFLGIPFYLIGCVFSGLITGAMTYTQDDYSGLHSVSRKDKPLTYWCAVIITSFIACWLIKQFTSIH